MIIEQILNSNVKIFAKQMKDTKDNKLYRFESSLLLAKNKKDFQEKILYFIKNELPYSRKINIESLFVNQKDTWRKGLISNIIEMIQHEVFLPDFEVEVSSDLKKFRKIDINFEKFEPKKYK